MKDIHWNPWHGCTKVSPGCKNCYMFAIDSSHNKQSNKVCKTKQFDLPVRRDKYCDYVLRESNDFIYTCLTSDFFHKDADGWRLEAWKMMKERNDLNFMLFTKRIDRFMVNLPVDWGRGYDNVYVAVSCENQRYVDERVSELVTLPIKHRIIALSPLLECVSVGKWLDTRKIEHVSVSGESSAYEARVLDYDWVLKVRQECLEHQTGFNFRQTGSLFLKDGRLYRLNIHKLQIEQAIKAGIDIGDG